MSHRLLFAFCASLLVMPAACGPGSAGGADAMPPLDDTDGDGITDHHEGKSEGRDSDGDGTPDYLDTDSDDDGIPDRDEAGDADPSTPPLDTDMDGTPDAFDTDADGNGIPDMVEGRGDADQDGIGDWRDLDNDGDTLPDVLEIAGTPFNPPDHDDDTWPDYMDIDSDGDTLLDADERAPDPDGDGVPSYLDLNSDGDCLSDAAEAGDADLSTPPRDSDGDGRPDFHELDSDGDGLLDSDEDANCNGLMDPGETSVTSADSDGDGVTDLIEVVAATDPRDPADNPQANGDFVFLAPYQRPPQPSDDDLDFTPDVRIMDVYVLIDRSGSMDQERDAIRSEIQIVANRLTCGAPGSDPATCISDIWWGVGSIGYQGMNGQSYTDHLRLQPNPALVSSSMPTAEPAGGCCVETGLLATWSTCTGLGSSASGCSISTPYPNRPSCASSAAGPEGVGYPCFRPNAMPVILVVTDEPPTGTLNCPQIGYPPPASMPNVVGAANSIGAKIVGIIGSATTTVAAQVRADLERLATGTGAVDATNGNRPLVENGADATADTAIENALRLLANRVPLDIATRVDDPIDDSVDVVGAFVERVSTLQLGTAECTGGLAEDDSNGDGFADRYLGVVTGTPVCWRLTPRMNTTVAPRTEPQLFRAVVTVYTGVGTELDSRDVYFLVPPEIPDIPID